MSLSSQPGTAFRDEDRLEDAQAHIEHAKSHAINNSYLLGHATVEQATIWYNQHRLEEARLEALRAANIFYDLGSTASSRRSPWLRSFAHLSLRSLILAFSFFPRMFSRSTSSTHACRFIFDAQCFTDYSNMPPVCHVSLSPS